MASRTKPYRKLASKATALTSRYKSSTRAPNIAKITMALLFGFGNLIYVMVLLLNAVAILSEDRFLARVGWSRNQREAGFGQQDSSVKVRIGELISGVRLVTRAPLIVANAAIITYELLFG